MIDDYLTVDFYINISVKSFNAMLTSSWRLIYVAMATGNLAKIHRDTSPVFQIQL